jgi:hypothetical protein
VDRSPSSVPIVYGSSDPRDRPPGAFVVLPYRVLRRLDPAGRSRAAGISRVPLEWVDDLVRDRLPLVVEVTAGASAAYRRAAELRRETGLRVEAATGPGTTVGVVGTVLLVAVTLAVLLWLGIGNLATLVAVVAGLLVARLVTLAQQRRIIESYDRGRRRLLEQRRSGAVAPVFDRLAELRRQLAVADLPDTAERDLRDALVEVEQHLDDVARSGADPSAVQQHLADVAATLAPASARSADEAELARMQQSVARLRAAARREGPG